MSIVRLLSPRIDLVDEVVNLINADGRKIKDFSDTIIIFPGKRPAHVLRKRLAEEIVSAFLPPNIFSIDLFIEYLSTHHCGRIVNPIDELDAVSILFDLHRQLQQHEQIGNESFSSFETFYPVGVKIYSELEELMMAEVAPATLKQAISSVTLASAHTLASLYEPFYQELEWRKFSTRGMNYRFVAEHLSTIDLHAHSKIIGAGFYAFTPVEQHIFAHLHSLQNVTLLFQNGVGIQSTLDQLHLHAEAEGEEIEPKIFFYESPDAHGQLFSLNTVFKERLAEQPVNSGEAVVVLPSAENLFPLYHQSLVDFDQSTYNIALGYPLSRTPVYGFLMSLLDVIVTASNGQVYVPKYLQFLLHPYTKNILYKTRTNATRFLVHAIENQCLDRSTRVFVSFNDIEQEAQLFDHVAERLKADETEISPDELRLHVKMIHDKTLRALLHVTSVGEFAEGCINVLQFINEHSTAHRHPYFRPFVETMLEQFAVIQRSLIATHSFTKLEHYFLFLQHYMKSAEIPFTGTPLQGLQVLGFLETRGLRFKKVFVIDVNDDVLPGKAQQDVLLPLALREQLKLSTYRDQEKIKAFIFDLLRRSADEVHLFYINNAEKEQSRYIAQLQWKEQFASRSLSRFNTRSQEYKIDLGTKLPQSIQKSEETIGSLKEMKFSSTALDAYLTCGLQFYYRYILRLREKEEISGDVEQTDIGKVIHTILYEYFAPAKDKPLTAADLDLTRLKKVIHDNFSSFYGSSQFGEQFFTKRQVEKHLIEFINQIQRPIIDSTTVTIEGLEQHFETAIDGFQLIGNADRIEKRNKKTFILDYKTGYIEKNVSIDFEHLNAEDRSTWKEAIGSIQLPMYVMLYSALTGESPEMINPAFLFLGKKELNERTEVPLFESEDQMKAWYPELHKIIFSLLNEIVNREHPFMPTDDIKKDCPSCPYKILCGTQWTDAVRIF